jgi:hypothetical protein
MSLTDLANLGSFVSGVAVAITLVFLPSGLLGKPEVEKV